MNNNLFKTEESLLQQEMPDEEEPTKIPSPSDEFGDFLPPQEETIPDKELEKLEQEEQELKMKLRFLTHQIKKLKRKKFINNKKSYL